MQGINIGVKSWEAPRGFQNLANIFWESRTIRN